MALEPAGRALESAGRGSEPAGRPFLSQVRAPRGWRKKDVLLPKNHVKFMEYFVLYILTGTELLLKITIIYASLSSTGI